MSKRAYIAGFCKAAEAMGVDPEKLARHVLEKQAQEKGIWDKTIEAIENLKKTTAGALGKGKLWLDENPTAKALAGTAGGSLLGLGLGSALAGKKGLRTGAILGAAGGLGASVDWKALSKALGEAGKKASEQAAKAKAEAEAKAQFAAGQSNNA